MGGSTSGTTCGGVTGVSGLSGTGSTTRCLAFSLTASHLVSRHPHHLTIFRHRAACDL